jgi:ElaB/YqjD/DUF883 family membrane-anchored ribosome-binding protein
MVRHELQELETLKADIAKLRSDLANLAQKLMDVGVDEVGGVRETLAGQVQSVMDTMRQVIGDTRERGRKTIEGVQQRVEERPYVILFVALAAGFLLTKLLELRGEIETSSGAEGSTQFGEWTNETVSDRVRSKAQDLKGRLGEAIGNTRERSRKAFETIHGQIEDSPIISLLVASGVGFLLGKLIDRRAKSGSSG